MLDYIILHANQIVHGVVVKIMSPFLGTLSMKCNIIMGSKKGPIF